MNQIFIQANILHIFLFFPNFEIESKVDAFSQRLQKQDQFETHSRDRIFGVFHLLPRQRSLRF